MEWNKRNILPFYNKGDTQSLKINCPVFLLLMSLKDSCLNKCICLLFYLESRVISSNQFGFKSRDSCINQRIAITNKIYKSSERELEQRGDSLDISKT